jgi:sec-independent protein translocase protein TatC
LLSFLIVWDYKSNILFLLTDLNLIFTSLTEAFEEYMYFSMIISLVLNVPLFLFHYFLFVLPGLYLFEVEKFVYTIVKYSVVLIFFYSILLNYVLDNIIFFFRDFESDYLVLNLKIKDFLSFINSFILGFLVIFMLPFLKLELNSRRRFIYMGLMLLIGLITPPDLLSLLLSMGVLFVVLEINYLLK